LLGAGVFVDVGVGDEDGAAVGVDGLERGKQRGPRPATQNAFDALRFVV